LQLRSDLFRDGLNLSRVAAGADHEKIGERGDFAQIQNTDIGSLL